MADLRHGACGSYEPDRSRVPLSVANRLSPEQAAAAEREYVEHRGEVLAMLRREFPRFRADVDELYQQAWIEFLELRATGATIANPRALLHKIAWRAARARVRRMKPELHEPQSGVLLDVPDQDPTPDEHAQVRIDADAVRVVVESLDDRHAAALKLRFDYGLSSREVQRVLGLSPKRLEKIVTEAYAELSAQLGPDPDADTTPWLRRQRSLLLACEAGVATSRQVRRAQRVVDADPRCRVMLAEMRATFRGLAQLLPMPVVVEDERHLSRLQSAFDRLAEL